MDGFRRPSLGEISDEISRYCHTGDVRAEYWYNCVVRGCTVYLVFTPAPKSRLSIKEALHFALDNDALGVEITWENGDQNKDAQRKVCPPRPLQEGAFRAEYRTIDYGQLTFVKELSINVHLVEYKGVKYAYKFIEFWGFQDDFEREFSNYVKIRGCEGVPELVAVVRKDGLIRGLLITYFEGQVLCEKPAPRHELPKIVDRIITIAESLEEVGFYHTELKGRKIIRRESDGQIFFIDFAPDFTPGFTNVWRDESTRLKCLQGKAEGYDMLYILGKTIWELWIENYPIHHMEIIPEPFQSLVKDCCIKRPFNSIKELRCAYPSADMLEIDAALIPELARDEKGQIVWPST